MDNAGWSKIFKSRQIYSWNNNIILFCCVSKLLQNITCDEYCILYTVSENYTFVIDWCGYVRPLICREQNQTGTSCYWDDMVLAKHAPLQLIFIRFKIILIYFSNAMLIGLGSWLRPGKLSLFAVDLVIRSDLLFRRSGFMSETKTLPRIRSG